MAFSWISVNVGVEVTSAQWNEVKTNTDTLVSNLGLSPYGWSEMPVTQNVSKPDPADTQELRNALDYVHNNNNCSAENSGYNSSYDGTDDVTVDATDNGTVNATADSTVNGGNNASVDGARDIGYDGTLYSSADNNEHNHYYSTKYLTFISDIRLKKDIVYL